MRSPFSLNKERTIIVLAVIFFHSLLWIHPGHLWDGVIADQLLATKRFAALQQWFYESQLPIEYWLYRLLDLFGSFSELLPTLLFVKLLYLVSLIGIGLSSYEITRLVFKLSNLEALIVALFAVSLPNYHVLTSSVHIMHMFCLGLFYVLWAIYLKMNSGASAGHSMLKQIPIAIALILTFFQSSLLVYHYVFVFFLWKLTPDKNMGLKYFLSKHWPVFIAPFAFYLPKILWFKTHGLYAGYNNVIIPTSVAKLKVLLFALTKFIYVPLLNLFYFPLREDITWILPYVALSSVLGFLFFRFYPLNKIREAVAGQPFNSWRQDFAIAGVCFLAAIFPYVMVGKYPTLGMDWNARQGLLLGYPFGLIVVLGVKAAIGLFKTKLQKNLAVLTGFGIFILFLATLMNSYLYWNVLSKRNLLLQNTLQKMPPLACGTYVLLRDNAVFSQPWQAQYSMHYILSQAWKDECWLVDSPLSLKPPQLISSKEEALAKLNEFWKKKRLYFYDTEEQRKIYRQNVLFETFSPNDQVVDLYLTSDPGKLKNDLFMAINLLRAKKPDPNLLLVEFRPL